MDDEAQRAMQYRIDQRKRIAARLKRERALAGSRAYRQQLEENWRPVLLACEPIEDIPDPFDENDKE